MKENIISERDELIEILAVGCLRLIIGAGRTQGNDLKTLDSSPVPSNQWDRELTTFEKGRKP